MKDFFLDYVIGPNKSDNGVVGISFTKDGYSGFIRISRELDNTIHLWCDITNDKNEIKKILSDFVNYVIIDTNE